MKTNRALRLNDSDISSARASAHPSVLNSAAAMNPLIFRPIQVVTYAFFALMAAALGVSAYLTYRQQQIVSSLMQDLGKQEAFDQTHVTATRLAFELGSEATKDPAVHDALVNTVKELEHLAAEPTTPKKLETFLTFVEQLQPGQYRVVLERISILQDVDADEESAALARLARVEHQMTTQLRLDVILPLALIIFAAVIFPLTRRRVIKPLEAFGRQLTRLGRGDFTPAPVEDVDWILLPLHRYYNELTRRLQSLEAAHKSREQTLETEVRSVTKTLLEQQHSLARAERLAATGELAASVAHELRNPLAAIHITLSNLRAELSDADMRERVNLVVNEVERLTRLLNQLVDAARHTPEPARRVELKPLVDDVVALTRYQVAPEVRFDSHVDPTIACVLPPDHLRQVILNLILNAASALRDRSGTIAIAAVRDGDRVRFTVSDDGPGFPPEMLEKGIRSFFSTREHGTGLGLAMVRRFAREVGGELRVANREPHGAEVVLILPAAGAPSARS